MRKSIAFAAAIGSLLLIGAGCLSRPSAEVERSTPVDQAPTTTAPTIPPPTAGRRDEVDDLVDDLSVFAADEQRVQAAVEQDGSEAESDSMQLNSLNDTSYDAE